MSLPFWNTWAISKELKIAFVNKQNDEVTDVLLLVVLEFANWSTWCRKGRQLKNIRPINVT